MNMSDGSPVSPELDARLLADLREWRARLHPTSLEGNRWSARLTIVELDALLRIADERDALRRAAVAEWEADIPAEVRERAGVGRELHAAPGAECTHEAWEERGGSRVCADCHAVLSPLCDVCGSAIVPDMHSTSRWRHVVRPIRLHAAKPTA